MRKNKFLVIILLFIFISNCTNDNINLIYTKVGVEVKKEIKDLDCVNFMNNKFSRLYDADFARIFKVKSPLDIRYYKDYESSRVDVFLAFDRWDLSGKYYFFGIDKNLSDFIFVNYFEELNMLTLDGHMRYNLDLSELADFGCIDLEFEDDAINSFYESIIFEYDSSKKYSIDSVLTKKDESLLFNQGDSFRVENNSKFIFESDTVYFYFDNYLMHISSDNDTIKFKMVSRSEDSKILLDLATETLYFLSRH